MCAIRWVIIFIVDFTSPGTYTVKLTVWEGEASDWTTMQIVIDPWTIKLRSVGFESKGTGKWHKIYRDKDNQDVYTSAPFTNPQWWDQTLLGYHQLHNRCLASL